MRKALLVALGVCLLAGCGGSKTTPSSVASAVEAKNVATLFKPSGGLASVRDVTCTEAAISGNYSCTGTPTFDACQAKSAPTRPCASSTAPTKAWIGCYPNPKSGPKLDCRLENPPAGTNVFVTAAQRAAPKVATWRCVQANYAGDLIGPLTISIAKTYGPVQTEPNALTEAQARALATSLHLPFRKRCG